MHLPCSQHQREIEQNSEIWRRNPLLRRVYQGFYEEISRRMIINPDGLTVEIGAGIGNLKSVLPHCVATDVFPNPWIDQVENAYVLSFGDGTIDNLLLFDVFHHLQYPGSALAEFHRALKPRGRLIIFEPDLSVLGWIVYGLFHQEPVGYRDPIKWGTPPGWDPTAAPYYSAQGNAARIFRSSRDGARLEGWRIVEIRRFSAISYVASGGFSRRQLYPGSWHAVMRAVDRLADRLPWLFSTRLLVVLERLRTVGVVPPSAT